jgi:hypothetical protein
LTVPVDGARHVAIRFGDAGSRRARDGVTVVTGTVTGSERPPAARALGYEVLRLETGDRQPEALGL